MITQSAKRAHRKNLKNRQANLEKKKALKKVIKTYKNLLAGGGEKDAKNALSSVYQVVDKTAKSGVIKKNTAARLKSRLTKLLVASR